MDGTQLAITVTRDWLQCCCCSWEVPDGERGEDERASTLLRDVIRPRNDKVVEKATKGISGLAVREGTSKSKAGDPVVAKGMVAMKSVSKVMPAITRGRAAANNYRRPFSSLRPCSHPHIASPLHSIKHLQLRAAPHQKKKHLHRCRKLQSDVMVARRDKIDLRASLLSTLSSILFLQLLN